MKTKKQQAPGCDGCIAARTNGSDEPCVICANERHLCKSEGCKNWNVPGSAFCVTHARAPKPQAETSPLGWQTGWSFERHTFAAVTRWNEEKRASESVALCWKKDDAVLFSAAPELLEAAKDALAYLEPCPESEFVPVGQTCNRCARILSLRAAIAKVEGR